MKFIDKDKAKEQIKTFQGKAAETFDDVKDRTSFMFEDLKDKTASMLDDVKEKAQQVDLKKIEIPKVDVKDVFKKKEDDGEKKVKLSDELEMALQAYNSDYEEMKDTGLMLFMERQRSVDLIDLIQNLINSIANHPKTFDTDFEEITTNKETFVGVCEFAEKELSAAKKSAMSAGGGIAAGAAVASIAPSAAMWIATTFGTASTGTAISALSGAAAQSAALAWLGGGTLAAGGTGMAGGQALLAMAGPIGWGIAGATLLTSVVLFSHKKIKNNKEMKEEIEKIKWNALQVRETQKRVATILEMTGSLRTELNSLYNDCLNMFGKEFTDLPKEAQMKLGALVNNTKALSATLGKNV